MGATSLSRGEDDGDEGIVAEINITPLTDIFLVLLIIFMVTSSQLANTGKQVALPSAEESSAMPKGVNVTIDADGGIQVNEQDVVGEEALAAALEAALNATTDKVVILRGDKDVVLGRAVHILDVAQQKGATGIALATKPPGRKPRVLQ